ncbi:MAG: 2Fe-2S iron-sulfur cluster binding domain-containing protein [Rubrivivax sp.]
MPQHHITIEGQEQGFTCAEDASLLAAMERTLCRAIPVGCRNGGCGACKVRITAGRYETGRMNRAVVSEEDERVGCVLACRTYPRGDIRLQVLGRVWRQQRTTFQASFSFGFAATTTIPQPDKET